MITSSEIRNVEGARLLLLVGIDLAPSNLQEKDPKLRSDDTIEAVTIDGGGSIKIHGKLARMRGMVGKSPDVKCEMGNHGGSIDGNNPDVSIEGES